jgi:hypothetical protein
VSFDTSLGKQFQISERFKLRSGLTPTTSSIIRISTPPNNDVSFFPGYDPPPTMPPSGSLGIIQHTIGSPRFLQLNMHLTF